MSRFADQQSTMEIQNTEPLHSFCTFQVDSTLYGIAVDVVQEVIRSRQTTRVPLAPKGAERLMNLRGEIVCTLNLREVLGLPTKASVSPAPTGGERPDCGDANRHMNVVIRSDKGLVSLIVDEIGDVVTVADNQSEPIPGSAGARANDLLRGAFQLDGRLLLILDADRVAAA